MKKFFFFLILSAMCFKAYGVETFVSFSAGNDYFCMINGGRPVPIVVDPYEDEGILMAVESLRKDILAVCGNEVSVSCSPVPNCIIIGGLSSPFIRDMLDGGVISRTGIDGKREKYILQVVEKPLPGVERALVIAGSDKRGTIYGIYELSRQMGVSPWYWWMDVPVARKENVYIKPGSYTDGEPEVEYRGIFINDEWPSFGEWANHAFGGINSRVYERVFELLLRLKGNFMWPAMWASAFYDDDSENGELADKMGIVMGTSHHEPMALAQQDWKRRGKGVWDYSSNSGHLKEFWTYGIERCRDWETVVTVGMRGDGDEPMSEEANIALLEKIIRDQRKIIRKVTGKSLENTPQVWALYKEVQDYYDQGMRVPDDVTLLLCDDNWGNVRKLPRLDEKPRKGGYGMYYHFDYVGAPRNSKWLNINPIPRIWEQMNLAYEYGVRKLWIVNVGDLKPMEYPITFFMDMAWNPERFDAESLTEHSEEFCDMVFGGNHSGEIAEILRTYAQYNRRVTPELLSSDTYSFNYDEWQRVVREYADLAMEAYNIRLFLPDIYHDAYDQLITYPVLACANLYDMYFAKAMNERLYEAGNPEADKWADRVEACFRRDGELTDYYNNVISGGKWKNMMNQVHIGYTSWNNPDEPAMPAVRRLGSSSARYSFREVDGCVSIEAEHFTRSLSLDGVKWIVLPDMGRTLSGITTEPSTVSPEGMSLEYDMNLTGSGEAKVIVRLSPTLNFNVDGLRYAVSFDGGEEQIVNVNGHYDGELGKWQAEHIIESVTSHFIPDSGHHTLSIRPLDPGLVFQKIMIDMGGLRDSYLGAPETLAF